VHRPRRSDNNNNKFKKSGGAILRRNGEREDTLHQHPEKPIQGRCDLDIKSTSSSHGAQSEDILQT
jgi:hypothetical protein